MIWAFEATYHFPPSEVRAMSWRDIRFWDTGSREVIADILDRKGLV